MAIKATYQDGSVTIRDAIVKLDRIWGSKRENWNAWVHVYEKETDTEPKQVFSVMADYVEGENPYTALYAAIGKLTFLTDQVSDVKVEPKSESKTEPKTKPKAKKSAT